MSGREAQGASAAQKVIREGPSAFERWELPAVAGSAGAAASPAGGAVPPTVAELEELRRQAREDGFAEGRAAGFAEGHREGVAAGRADADAVGARLSAVLAVLSEPLEALDQDVEQSLVSLAVAIARQLVRRELKTDPGQVVAASFQAPVLFTLAEDLTKMELHVDVDEADVGLVREGQAATFTVDAYPDRTFPARITRVRYGSQTVDGVVTYETVLEVDNSDLLLRPGMTATADIVIRKVEAAILVPNVALRFSPPVKKKPSPGPPGGLMQKLLPGPPRRNSPRKGNINTASQEKLPCVWTLCEGRLLPIPVATGATDGIMTEVKRGNVEPGMVLAVATVSLDR